MGWGKCTLQPFWPWRVCKCIHAQGRAVLWQNQELQQTVGVVPAGKQIHLRPLEVRPDLMKSILIPHTPGLQCCFGVKSRAASMAKNKS